KALEIKEQLVARYPDVPDYQANLVRSLAAMTRFAASPAQARSYQHRAETLARELNRRHPGVAQYQRALANSFEARADLHVKAGGLEEAIAALDDAIAVREKLVRATNVPAHRARLIQICGRKARLALQAGKMDLAAAVCRKAISINPMDARV